MQRVIKELLTSNILHLQYMSRVVWGGFTIAACMSDPYNI